MKKEHTGWLRYEHAGNHRYYDVLLQQDLFGDWSVMRVYGGKHNNRGGYKIESFDKLSEAEEKVAEIAKRRHKRGYELINVKR